MKIELNKKLEDFLYQIHHIMKEKRKIKASVQSIANNMLLLFIAEEHDINIMREDFVFPPESKIDYFLESFIKGVKIYVKEEYDKDYQETPEERLQEHLEYFDRNKLTLTNIVRNEGNLIEIEFIEPKK